MHLHLSGSINLNTALRIRAITSRWLAQKGQQMRSLMLSILKCEASLMHRIHVMLIPSDP